MCLTFRINVFMAISVLAQLHVGAEPSLAESLIVAAMEFLHANVIRILVQVNLCFSQISVNTEKRFVTNCFLALKIRQSDVAL